ncbi:hypothetical protein LUZ62_048056 [Rhynchospora pubera]|uniref:Uncharacterized protein n=1 Tax=Rhynchospora pubera TaxID=906938 RepID=A0AAV8FXK9_9POAL|nr:hypothetical protein LUZ62_048056 [Rhynchospora pubera]
MQLHLYQRLSPDCLPLPAATTGRKPDLAPNPNPTLVSNSNLTQNQARFSPNSEAKSSRGARSPPEAPSTSTSASHGEINGGDLLLQWGHNKRTRGPRTSQAGDDSASSHLRSSKIQRRSSVGTTTADKLMPPPQAPVGSYTRGANLRSAASLPNHHRAVEEHHRSRGEKRTQQSEKNQHKSNGHHHPDGGMNQADAKQHHLSDHDPTATSNGTGGEKGGLEHFEWPRIYISLSRKEKEDDFLAMKGTKLPQRPKKRAKNVDKTLQYVFPGMWLSDLTKGRYEVREKKCVKKKRRGLKGMESMDSDSE